MAGSSERETYFGELLESELKGGIIISEYSAFLARDAEAAFVCGAFISTVIVCCSAIEAHIRFEGGQGNNLHGLMAHINVSEETLVEINAVRQFRNKWVHVRDPEMDERLQKECDVVVDECEAMARRALKCLVKVLCADQYV